MFDGPGGTQETDVDDPMGGASSSAESEHAASKPRMYENIHPAFFTDSAFVVSKKSSATPAQGAGAKFVAENIRVGQPKESALGLKHMMGVSGDAYHKLIAAAGGSILEMSAMDV